MAYFEWADDMAIDQGPIDEDHKMLVRQVNELHTATSEGRGHEIVARLLDELVRDTLEHIRREEHYMESIGYPQLAQHRAGHDHFVSELRGLQDKYNAGSITVAPRLSMLLRDWLSLHIRRYDKDIAVFLRKKKHETARTPR